MVSWYLCSVCCLCRGRWWSGGCRQIQGLVLLSLTYLLISDSILPQLGYVLYLLLLLLLLLELQHDILVLSLSDCGGPHLLMILVLLLFTKLMVCCVRSLLAQERQHILGYRRLMLRRQLQKLVA